MMFIERVCIPLWVVMALSCEILLCLWGSYPLCNDLNSFCEVWRVAHWECAQERLHQLREEQDFRNKGAENEKSKYWVISTYTIYAVIFAFPGTLNIKVMVNMVQVVFLLVLLSWSGLELRRRCGKARHLIGSETRLSCNQALLCDSLDLFNSSNLA